MPNPWEKYAAPTTDTNGPWAKYGAPPPTAPAPKPGDFSYRDTRPLSERLKAAVNEPTPMPGSMEGHPENLAGYVEQGPGEMLGGAGDIAKGNIAKGGHRMISGFGTTVAPAAPFAAVGAPAMAARAVAGGYVGSKLAAGGAELAGANPEQQEFAGDIGNLAGGFTAASGLIRALLQSPVKALVETQAGNLLKVLQPRKAAIDYLQGLLEDTIAGKGPPKPAPSAPVASPAAKPAAPTSTAPAAPASTQPASPNMQIYKEPVMPDKPVVPSKTPLLDELQRWDQIRRIHSALDEQIGAAEDEMQQWVKAHNQPAPGAKPPTRGPSIEDLLRQSIKQVQARKGTLGEMR